MKIVCTQLLSLSDDDESFWFMCNMQEKMFE